MVGTKYALLGDELTSGVRTDEVRCAAAEHVSTVLLFWIGECCASLGVLNV